MSWICRETKSNLVWGGIWFLTLALLTKKDRDFN